MSLKTKVLCAASVAGLGFFICMVLGPVFAGEEVKTDKRDPAAVTTPLKYPPPPADPTQLPAPVKKYVKMIADLCNTNDLSKQVPQLQAALNGLKHKLPSYFGKVNEGDLREIYINLFDEMYIGALWGYLNTNPKTRFNAAGEYLHGLIRGNNLPEDTGPELFSREWEHQIYKGLYCISHDNPRPPKTSLAKKPDAS